MVYESAALTPLTWVRAEWFNGLRLEPTLAEFTELIDGTTANSAPGPSQISNALLKHMPLGPWRNIIWKIICAALRHCVVPADLKLASIWLIPKTTERNPPPERCRPISLLETILKLIEALPIRRLRSIIAEHGLLSSLQYGFGEGCSTSSPLQILAAAIAHANETDGDLDVALVDFKQAFDRPPPWAFRAALARIGIPERDITFFMALQDEAFSVVQTAYGATDPYPILGGARQGTKFGPLLYPIYADIYVQMQLNSQLGYRFPVHPHPPSACTLETPCSSTITSIPVVLYVDDTTNLAGNNADCSTLVSIIVKFNNAFGGSLHPDKSQYSFRRRNWKLADYENHASRFAQYLLLRENGATESSAMISAMLDWNSALLGAFPWPPIAVGTQRCNLCPNFQAMLSLGCWFSLDGSTLHQERIIRDTVDSFCACAIRKRHSISEMRYLLNVVLLPRVVYPARVQLPPPAFLASLDARIASTIIKSCGLQKGTASATIFALDGLGMPCLSAAATGAAIEETLAVLNNDWSAEARVLIAESAVAHTDTAECRASTTRAVMQASWMRAPQTALVSRLQSLATQLCIPGCPLSYPFHKSLWRSIRAPYLARVWEAMSSLGIEFHSRMPGLQNDPRCMLADVIPPQQYHRIAAVITRCAPPLPGSPAPQQPLWTLSQVVRRDGLGLRSRQDLTGGVQVKRPRAQRPLGASIPSPQARERPIPIAWLSSLSRFLKIGRSKPIAVTAPKSCALLGRLKVGEWQVALDYLTHAIGDVVCVWLPVNVPLRVALRTFIVRQTLLDGRLVGLAELIPSQGFGRWRLPAYGTATNPLPLSLRDVGPLPLVAPPQCHDTDASDLVWMCGQDVIPLVGGWAPNEEDEDGDSATWMVPFSHVWLQHSYDGEVQRRLEITARIAAGDEHPLRRIRAALLQCEIQPPLPQPQTQRYPERLPTSINTAPAKRQIEICCAGAAPIGENHTLPLGAAVAYANLATSPRTPPFSCPSTYDTCFTTLSVRREPGATLTSPERPDIVTAETLGLALALQAVAALRNSFDSVRISSQSAFLPAIASKLQYASLGRRRLCKHPSDAANLVQAYHLLQQFSGLPKPIVSVCSTQTEALACVQQRSQLAAFSESPSYRVFPLASDWGLAEHNGERVYSRIASFVVKCFALQSRVAWAHLPSQGRVIRHTPLAPSNFRAAAMTRGGPTIKSTFRSATGTQLTRRGLNRCNPIAHPSGNCLLPGCNPTLPDDQAHALLVCNSVTAERDALRITLASAIRKLGPPHFWNALTPGPRLGNDNARTTTLSAFSTTSIAPTFVDGVSLAMVRQSPDPPGSIALPMLGAVLRIDELPPPPLHATRRSLIEWNSRTRSTWTALPTHLLLNMVFLWQSTDTASDTMRPDSLLCAVAVAASSPVLGSDPHWPALHHAISDILMDTLSLRSCVVTSALLTPRRSIQAILAPDSTPTPLDELIGCNKWSTLALCESAIKHGTLILLPPTDKEVSAALCELALNRRGGRFVVLIPWDATAPQQWRQTQSTTLTHLTDAGFRAVATLPAALVVTTKLVSFGRGLLSQRSSDSTHPHILLTSWDTTSHAMANALLALGAFAELRATARGTPLRKTDPVGTPTPSPSLPWHIELAVPTGDTNANWPITLNHNCCVTQVAGPNAARIVAQIAALRSTPPEDFLFPHLLTPLPTLGRTPPPSVYLGAALDDNCQPHPGTGCEWLPLTTLQTLAAGSVPAALHKVILPWVQQRSLSARRENPQSNLAGVIPSGPLATTVPLPSSPTHHGDTKTVTAAVIQCSTLLWAKRNALLAAHSSHNPSPGQQHKRRQRPPVEPESPLPPVDSRIEAHGEIPQQPSNSHLLPPLADQALAHHHPHVRVLHPGRDPTHPPH